MRKIKKAVATVLLMVMMLMMIAAQAEIVFDYSIFEQDNSYEVKVDSFEDKITIKEASDVLASMIKTPRSYSDSLTTSEENPVLALCPVIDLDNSGNGYTPIGLLATVGLTFFRDMKEVTFLIDEQKFTNKMLNVTGGMTGGGYVLQGGYIPLVRFAESGDDFMKAWVEAMETSASIKLRITGDKGTVDFELLPDMINYLGKTFQLYWEAGGINIWKP